MNVANIFANKGWMSVAIDSVTFGARAAEPNFHTDKDTFYGKTYNGPDGFADAVDGKGNDDPVHGATNGSSDLFGGLQNIGSIRDQMRTAAIDTAQLMKVLLSNPDLSPLMTGTTVPKIDPTRIAYLGDSLGAIQGVTAGAIEPHLKNFFFNVVGAGLFPELASHSPTISFQLQEAGALFFGFTNDSFSESHPFDTIAETIVDPGDPLMYASYLVTSPGSLKGQKNAPKSFVQTQVLFDEIVSNESNEAFLRAAGISLATPNVGSNAGLLDLKNPATNPMRLPLKSVDPDGSGAFHDTPIAGITAVAVQVSPAEHGVDLVRGQGAHQFAIPFGRYETPEPFTRLDAPFNVTQSYLQLEQLMTRFFDDGFNGKVPNVSGFKAPVRDYDGDGATDDVDADPSNPAVK
jgi:hypothetical protein